MALKLNDVVEMNLPEFGEKIGHIEKIGYSDIHNDRMLLVRLTDGSLIKCLESNVSVVSEPEDEEADQVTLTREEYRKRVALLAICEDDFETGAVIMGIGKAIEYELFGKPKKNV